MDLIYLLVLLACFIGLFAGVLISFLSKEELKDGRKYFVLCKNVLFALIVFLLFYFFKINLIFNLIMVSILIFVLFKFKIKEYLTYNLLGIIFFISYLNTDLFKINSSLIFIYSLFIGSLFAEKNIKLSKLKLLEELVLNYSLFLLLGIVFWFLRL